MSPVLAANWVPWIVGLSILSIVILVLILVAPWRSVRSEHGLDEEAETRLLLGEDPEQIERDLEAREAERRSRVSELRPRDER